MNIALYILAILTNTLPRWYHPITGDMFCQWQALSFVFLAIATTKTKTDTIIRDFVFLLSVGNLIDEVFGTAKTNSTGEYLFAALLFLWTIYRLTKCRYGNTKAKS